MTKIILPDSEADIFRIWHHLDAYVRGYKNGDHSTLRMPKDSKYPRLYPRKKEFERTLWEACLDGDGSGIVTYGFNQAAIEKKASITEQWLDCLKDVIKQPDKDCPENRIEFPAMIYVVDKLDEFAKTPENFQSNLEQFHSFYQSTMQLRYTSK